MISLVYYNFYKYIKNIHYNLEKVNKETFKIFSLIFLKDDLWCYEICFINVYKINNILIVMKFYFWDISNYNFFLIDILKTGI